MLKFNYLFLAILLWGCDSSSGGGSEPSTDLLIKEFDTNNEQVEYAQYVADIAAAISDAVLQTENCINSDNNECSVHDYLHGEYVLKSTTNITVEVFENKKTITAKQTNPDQQVFLYDANTNEALISMNLLHGTFSIVIEGESAPYSVILNAQFTDGVSGSPDLGKYFSSQTTEKFTYNNLFISGGEATTFYKGDKSYKWEVDESGSVSLH